jgi:hypothetical protein
MMHTPAWLDLAFAGASLVCALIEIRRWRTGRGSPFWVCAYAAMGFAFMGYWFFRP